MRMKIHVKTTLISTMACSVLMLMGGCTATDIKASIGQGDAVATTSQHLAATNPDSVKIYYSKHGAPKHYTIVGRVSAAQYNVLGITQSQESINRELKKQAATLGANAVMDVNPGMTNTTGNAVIVKKQS